MDAKYASCALSYVLKVATARSRGGRVGAQRTVPILKACEQEEALTNVLKHAGPARATVRLTYGADALVVSIQDDGAQAAVPNVGGHGLIGIRERVAVVGGEVTAGPGTEGGFEVRARLPYALEAS